MAYSFDWEIVSSGGPAVTLSSFGIAFNSASITLLGKPDKVVIGFDEEKMILGVKPYTGDLNVSKIYEFASREREGWIRIGCKDFIRYLSHISKIDFISRAKKFIAEYDKENNILLIPMENLKS